MNRFRRYQQTLKDPCKIIGCNHSALYVVSRPAGHDTATVRVCRRCASELVGFYKWSYVEQRTTA